MGNSNQENKKVNISVDELLRRKRERNEKNKQIHRNNFQARNEAIAQRHEQNTGELLSGEAQIDLQNRLLDAENRAIENHNAGYIEMTNRVIEAYDAKADRQAELINSAEDVTYMVIEEASTPAEQVKSLPPRRTRFTNTLFASEATDLALPSSEEKKLPVSKNPYDV